MRPLPLRRLHATIAAIVAAAASADCGGRVVSIDSATIPSPAVTLPLRFDSARFSGSARCWNLSS